MLSWQAYKLKVEFVKYSVHVKIVTIWMNGRTELHALRNNINSDGYVDVSARAHSSIVEPTGWVFLLLTGFRPTWTTTPLITGVDSPMFKKLRRVSELCGGQLVLLNV